VIKLENIKKLRNTDASATGVFVSFNGELIGGLTPGQIIEAEVGYDCGTGHVTRYKRDYKGEVIMRDDAMNSAETETIYGVVEFFCMPVKESER